MKYRQIRFEKDGYTILLFEDVIIEDLEDNTKATITIKGLDGFTIGVINKKVYDSYEANEKSIFY